MLLALLITVCAGQYFVTGPRYGLSGTPVLVASCDLSGDGVRDIITTNYNGNVVTVLINTGGSSYQV